SAAEDRELAGPAWSMHAAQVGSAATAARFAAVVSHHGLDRAVTSQVPDVRALDAAARGRPEAPLAHADELRRRHALLLADSRFADAMAPSEEVTDPPKPPPDLGVPADGVDAGGTAPQGHRTRAPNEQVRT